MILRGLSFYNPDGQTLGNLIKERFGADAWQSLASFFNDAAADSARTAHTLLDGVSGFLAQNMTVTYLAGNLGTAVKQLASYPRFLLTAGPHRIFYNTARYQVQKAVFGGGAASWIPMMNRLPSSYPSPSL